MKKTIFLKKAMSIILSTLMILSIFSILVVYPVNAASTDNFNNSYSLGNDPGQNMVNIAYAQIGKTGSQLGYNDAWCAYFVSDCAELAGQSEAIPRHGRADCIDQKILTAGGHKVSKSEARPGDIAFYDGNYNGSPDHVEIVYSVSGSTVKTLGGNTGSTGSIYSNKVSSPRAYGNILYIIRPNYSGGSVTTPEECNCSESYAGYYEVIGQGGLYLRSGHGTNYSQITMIPIGAVVYVSKGNSSWAHVTYNGQSGYCSMTYLKKVSSSGSANPDDYPIPTRNLYVTSPYISGDDVRWVQAVLNQLGYELTIDGIYGSGTKSKVISFQNDNGLTADGVVGENTRQKMSDLWNAKKLPSYKGISVSKNSYDINDDITITVEANNAESYVIGIDKDGEGRVVTESCGNAYTINASWLGAGTYSAYFSVYNSAGFIDTERVYFSITDYRGQEMTTGAGYTIPDGEYIITSGLWQNLYLDILGVNYPANSGENIVIYEGKEELFGESEKYDSWKVTYLNNGFYKISQNGTNMCLDVTNASLDRGTNVQICTDNGSAAQQWSIDKTSIGYKIQSRCNGYVLDVKDFNKTSGTNVLVWEDAGTQNQSWGFVPFASDDRPIADGEYYIKSACGDVWLDAAGDWNYEHGTNIQVWDSKTDSYSIRYVGDGYYRIYEVTSGLALNVYNTGYNCIENGVNVHLCDVYANSRAQLWRIKDEGNGYYSLISKLGGYALDLTGGQADKGTNVQQYAYNASDAQKWSFECVHSYGDWTTTKEATCTSDGLQTRECLTCGKIETNIIAKTGHKYTIEVIVPTYMTQGYTLHTCSACGDSYKDNYTDMLFLNSSAISTTNIILGQSINLTGKATGGTAPYKYKYYCKPEGDKNWTALTGSTTATSFTHKPARAIKYQYAVKIADSKGKTATKYFTVNVSPAPLANASSISTTSITKGQTIILNAKATGGTAPYKYKYYCKPEGDKNWTALTGSTTAISFTHKPARTIKYQYAVKIADSKGKTSTKYFTVNVNPVPLANASSISATSITKGQTIILNAKATGGTAPYKYKYYCKPEGDKDWTALTGSTTATSFTHKPARTIKYQYAVKIADSKGKTSTKYFTVSVSK